VALCVVSISIVALLNCHTVSLRNYVYSQIISRATLLAEEKMNELETESSFEFDEEETEEYENGLQYVADDGDFYDEEETELIQPEWRKDYWWRSIIEETEYTGVRKITLEVFFCEKKDESSFAWPTNVDPWDEERIAPMVRLVTYVATTNRREDSRSGATQSRRERQRTS